MFGYRVFFYVLICLSCFLQCRHKEHIQDFSISQHKIKLHYDPVSHDLTAVDTISISYGRNVDRLYFFLHKSLHVERIGVGHQDFQMREMTQEQIAQICQDLTQEWQQIVKSSQIVAFSIPKSLYSDKIQVRYRGTIDLTENITVAWHPALPGRQSNFYLTTLVPVDYQIITSGEKEFEKVDDMWRLNQWNINESRPCCKLMIEPASL